MIRGHLSRPCASGLSSKARAGRKAAGADGSRSHRGDRPRKIGMPLTHLAACFGEIFLDATGADAHGRGDLGSAKAIGSVPKELLLAGRKAETIGCVRRHGKTYPFTLYGSHSLTYLSVRME